MALSTKARAMEYFNYDEQTGQLIVKLRDRKEFDPPAYGRHIRRVGKPSGYINADGYIKVIIDGNYYCAHRVIWLIKTGSWPDQGLEIDHINGDRSDNRFKNLRMVTKSENQRNSSTRVNNTSGIHGVNWKPRYNSTPGDGCWVARIWNGPRHVYLGVFKEKAHAEIARKSAEKVLGFTGTDRKPNEFAARRTQKAREARTALKAKQMGVGE